MLRQLVAPLEISAETLALDTKIDSSRLSSIAGVSY
jgi:hypothetical protein